MTYKLLFAVTACLLLLAIGFTQERSLAYSWTGEKTSDQFGALTAESMIAAPDKPASGLPPNVPTPDNVRQGGDNIGSATGIPSLPFSDNGTTTGYIDDYDEVCPYDGTGSPDVVYSYTASSNGYLTIDLCNSGYDTKTYVYENTYTPGAPYACNDDACGDDGYKSQIVDMPVTGGNVYYIVVDGYDEASHGTYDLSVTAGAEPEGACCMPDNSCEDLIESECLAAGGDFSGAGTVCLGDEDQNGQDDACQDACPVDISMFSQSFMPPSGGWSAGVSDLDHASQLKRFERFETLPGDIVGAVVWGIRAYHDGVSWSECAEDPMPLEVILYTDNDGAVGTQVHSETIYVTAAATSYIYSGFTLYEYRFDLSGPVALSDGWISIQGVGQDPTCWFLWINAASGLDGVHVMFSRTEGTTTESDDLSLCLLEEPPIVTGACCFADGSCATMEQADCEAAGGQYVGDDAPCDPNPCTCCNLRGDMDNSEVLDVSDLTYYVDYMFGGGPAPVCEEEGDVDNNTVLDVSDLTYLVDWLFGGGPDPVPCP